MQELNQAHPELEEIWRESFGRYQPVRVSPGPHSYILRISHHENSSDTEAELSLIRDECLAGGADGAVVSNHWAKGGAGARALAEAVIATCEGESEFKFLYDLNLPIEEKICIVAREIYGADGIELSELAKKQVDTYTKQGYRNLPSKPRGSFCPTRNKG